MPKWERYYRKDGEIRLTDLMDYVPTTVVERAKTHKILVNGRREAHQQTPMFKRIENLGGEHFVICKYSLEDSNEVSAKANKHNVTKSKKDLEKEMINPTTLKQFFTEDTATFFEQMENLFAGDPENLNRLLQKKNKLKKIKREYDDGDITREVRDVDFSKIERSLYRLIDEKV